MFTGIVEETGYVEFIHTSSKGIRLILKAKVCGADLKVGDSLAANGCCLTVVAHRRRTKLSRLEFDLLQETWDRTSFANLRLGSAVNLERSLPVSGRLGGHFVTGHIDAVGRILRWEPRGPDYLLEVRTPKEVQHLLVPKGSVAIDGISLTLARVKPLSFEVWIIPHTRAVTNLKERLVGDSVNLEADILGKYVHQMLKFEK